MFVVRKLSGLDWLALIFVDATQISSYKWNIFIINFQPQLFISLNQFNTATSYLFIDLWWSFFYLDSLSGWLEFMLRVKRITVGIFADLNGGKFRGWERRWVVLAGMEAKRKF